MLVHELMTPHTLTVRADDSVRSALEVLAAHRVSALPVVDEDGRITGVVSEADLIRELVPHDRRAHALTLLPHRDLPRRVADVMTTRAVTVTPHSDVAEVVALITAAGIRSVPVVDEHGVPVGMLSRADVVGVLARGDVELERQVRDLLDELGLAGCDVRVRDGVVELDAADDADPARVADAAAATVAGVVEVVRRPADLR